MKKFFKKSLYMLVAGAFVASCADYNDLGGFSAEKDPSKDLPFTEYNAINSYIDREKNPNMQIGATLDIAKFNEQGLEHAAVMTNFDNVSFGKSLMSGTIINNNLGVMNFMNLMDLLDHMDEIGGTVFGSPLAANTNQCDSWLAKLTAPVEIAVDFVPGVSRNFNDYAVGDEPCVNKATKDNQKAKIAKFDGQNVLKIPSQGKVDIVDGFEVDPNATYTCTFWARAENGKNASFYVNFSGNKVMGNVDATTGKWSVADKWQKVSIESKSAEDVTEGYLEIETVRGSTLYIQKVEEGYYPDNHMEQTAQEKSDTIKYALTEWCDGFMKINEGRIKTFDLIEEAIDNTTFIDGSDIYDLKQGTSSQIFWQDVLGHDNYAPAVANTARAAYAYYKYELDKVEDETYISPSEFIRKFNPNDATYDVSELKFFISESGLTDPIKMKSLAAWIQIWDGLGAKIDGITVKADLVCYEDPAMMAECKAAYEAMLESLAQTGKLVRLVNFDIKYANAEGSNVNAKTITDEQRNALAEFNKYAIKAYMSKIPQDKQAGICKSVLVDAADPTGLWNIPDPKVGDWRRTATYKAWCEALGGE